MASIVTIFDHFMRPLTELDTATTPRGWVINGYGRCDFSMSLSDPKVTVENLQFGNLIHIQHIPTVDEAGNVHGKLPDWTGIILPPQSWDKGIIHCTAYSAEAILQFRAMPMLDNVKGSVGTIFSKIIASANDTAKNIVIHPGVVENKAGNYSQDFRLSAYEQIIKLTKAAMMDWNVVGEIDVNGNLLLYANLYNRIGMDTDLVLNSDNTRLRSPMLTVQGTPANQVFGFSHAQTAQTRYGVEGRNEAAIADYGPLQLNTTFLGVHDEAATREAANSLAARRGRPVMLFHRTALDVGDTFSKLAPGNTCLIHETEVGFRPGGGFGLDATVKILSVDYNDLTIGECPLNIEVI